MPPNLALLLWFILLVALFRFDPAKEKESSPALWVPLAWMFFLGSRLPAQWLGVGRAATRAQAYEEGNLFDRMILFGLILLALAILSARSFRWGRFMQRNLALIAFLSYALLSFMWSDFPLTSLKRWIRDLGNYLVILVVLSDPRPFEAVRTLLRRLCYLLVPLSVVLVKYFPTLGRGYSEWTGAAYYQGVGTTKNMLGVVCLVSGLFFFWDTLVRWAERKERPIKRILLVNAAMVAMTLWLLNLADSATSTLCLALGCAVIAAAHSGMFRRHPARLKVLIPVFIGLYLVLEMGFDISALIARLAGRDPTLTGRTEIWNLLLSLAGNPIIGTGYEGFWLGERLRTIWRETGINLNQAHNGYLEVYLNLGIVGLGLIAIFLIAAYKNICKGFGSAYNLATLSMALWTILLFYNVTEAALKGQLLWLTFLLLVIVAPARTEELLTTPGAAGPDGANGHEQFAKLPLETAGHRR